MNAFCERWVLSVKSETLSRLVLFGEEGLRRALAGFLGHYHSERNHQGKDNLLLFPGRDRAQDQGEVKCTISTAICLAQSAHSLVRSKIPTSMASFGSFSLVGFVNTNPGKKRIESHR